MSDYNNLERNGSQGPSGTSTNSEAEIPLVVNEENDTTVYQAHTQRWFVLMSFCVYMFTLGVAFIYLDVVDDQTRDYYNISKEQNIWISNVILISFLPLAIPGSILVVKHFMWCNLCAAVLLFIGSWVKYIAGPSYLWVMIGQTLTAISQIPGICSLSRMSMIWFPKHEQGIALAIPLVINYTASAIPFPIESSLVNHGMTISDLNLAMAIFSSVTLVLFFIFVRDKPKTPANFLSTIEPTPVMTEIKMIVTSKKTLAFSFLYGIVFAIGYSVLVVISEIVNPNGHHNMESGMLGFCFNTIGAFFSFAIEHRIKRMKKFHQIIPVMSFFGALSLCALALSLKYSIASLSYIFVSLAGICTVGLVPVCIQSAVELSYPVAESNSTQVMMVVSTGMSSAINAIVSLPGFTDYAFWSMGGLLFLVAVGLMFVKFEYKKTKFEKRALRYSAKEHKTHPNKESFTVDEILHDE